MPFYCKPTEDFANLEIGLTARGFTGTEGIDSLGKCHKNNEHYVLRTDGLVIYSNYPWAHSPPNHRLQYKETWGMEEFTFDLLDEVIRIVDE